MTLAMQFYKNADNENACAKTSSLSWLLPLSLVLELYPFISFWFVFPMLEQGALLNIPGYVFIPALIVGISGTCCCNSPTTKAQVLLAFFILATIGVLAYLGMFFFSTFAVSGSSSSILVILPAVCLTLSYVLAGPSLALGSQASTGAFNEDVNYYPLDQAVD